ncbi:hypothetical protein [Bacillus subtilis]|uniref:hypothetical protein n=1 Tax=Bacillus subtilis TaxID=1423 RepID=UPI001063AB8F|nr:hypothetical protein [Bacillus subtilis]TDU08486.1 hypothetical protein DFO78_11320 [Bacillus subtilis]
MNSDYVEAAFGSLDFMGFDSELVMKGYKERIDQNIEGIQYIPKTWLPLIYDLIFDEEKQFWNKDIKDFIYNLIDEVKCKNVNTDLFFENFRDSLDNFFLALSSYDRVLSTLNLFNKTIIPRDTEIQVKYLPLYNSLVEGVVSNLYKFLRNLLNTIDDKDLLSQNNLGPLVNLLNSKGCAILTKEIDVDIRNAINHGGTYLKEKDKIIFNFTNRGKPKSKEVSVSQFKRQIYKIIDLVNGLLAGIVKFNVKNYKSIAQSICSNTTDIVYQSWIKLEMSTYNLRCNLLNVDEINNQVNLYFSTYEVPSNNELIQFGIFTFVKLVMLYPESDRLFLTFNNDKQINSFLLTDTADIIAYIQNGIDAQYLVDKISRNSLFGANFQDDDTVSGNYTLHCHYHDIKEEEYIVKNIRDTSTNNLKRFKIEIYMKNSKRRSHVKKEIVRIIDKVRHLENFPEITHDKKYGKMPADVIFMDIFKEYGRKSDRKRYIMSSNDNFIAQAQYFSCKEYKVNKERLSKDLVVRTEGNIEFAWNPNF